MPALHKLASRRIDALTEPGLHSDGGGLYLRVGRAAAGRVPTKSWTFIFHTRAPGSNARQRKEMGLGAYPGVKLADAREQARLARETVMSGRDPRAVRNERAEAKRRKPTFAEEAALVLATLSTDWRGAKTVARWNLAMKYAAAFAAKPVDEVTTDDVLAVLEPIWRAKPEIAQKTRSAWERVFDAARARAIGRREVWTHDNPARWTGHLKLLLAKPVKLSRGHHAALKSTDVNAFMAKLCGHSGAGRHALEFTILTAVRTGTALGATWSEIDMDAGVWAIPVGRMKNAEELADSGFTHFRVPLASRAVRLLRRLALDHDGAPAGNSLVFRGQGRNGGLSTNTMRALVIRMGYSKEARITVHGFRTTFRTWAGKQMEESRSGLSIRRFSNEALEFSLGHMVGSKVQRAYDRQDYFEERQDLMQAWALYATSELIEDADESDWA